MVEEAKAAVKAEGGVGEGRVAVVTAAVETAQRRLWTGR